MELLQIIESSVFLFSLFGIFLLLISFASYRMKRTNGKLILQTVHRNPPTATHATLNSLTAIKNVNYVDNNSFLKDRFIILNENLSVTNSARKENHLFDDSPNSVQSIDYERLRPAKFYSLDELK